MKVSSLLLISFLIGSAGQGSIAFSPATRDRVVALMRNIGGTDSKLPYTTEAYFAELDELGRQASRDSAVLKALKEGGAETPADFLVLLAVKAQDPGERQKVDELRLWYGCYDYQILDSTVQDFCHKHHMNTFRSLPTKEGAMKRAGGPKVCALLSEHTDADYLTAWEVWLMAPQEGPKVFMAGTTNEALLKIGDPSCIPLSFEAYKTATAAAEDSETKQKMAVAYANLIAGIPGEKALDALLECNRLAFSQNYAGKGVNGFARHLVRRLSSRNPYADQLTDPEMAPFLSKREGRPPENPENIPRTDQNWKIYKPLIEAKLKAADKNTPPEDIELMKQALEAMPKE